MLFVILNCYLLHVPGAMSLAQHAVAIALPQKVFDKKSFEERCKCYLQDLNVVLSCLMGV